MGVPLIVIVLFAHAAVTPEGKPVAVPIPVAPVVVWLIDGDKAVLIQTEGEEDAAVTVFCNTVIVPVAVTVLHPPVNGIL